MTTKTISTKFRIKLPNRRSSKSGHRQPKCTLNSRRRKHEKPECTESQTNNDNNNNFDYGYQRWIAKVKDYCAKYHLLEMLNDPNRCFSIMDMPFRIPAGKEATDDSSQTATFSLILGGNAAGLMTLPTFVLHEAELYDAIQKEIPANWAIGRTISKLMTSEDYFDYILHVLRPFVVQQGIQLPVVIFVKSSGLNFTIDECHYLIANGIQLMALYPNVSPLDLVLEPLTRLWSEILKRSDSMQNEQKTFLYRVTFLKEAHWFLTNSMLTESLKAGFSKSKFLSSLATPHELKKDNLPKGVPDSLQKYGSNPISADLSIRIGEAMNKILADGEHTDSWVTSNAIELLDAFENRFGAEMIVAFHAFDDSEMPDGKIFNEKLYKIWKELSETANDLLITEMVECNDDD